MGLKLDVWLNVKVCIVKIASSLFEKLIPYGWFLIPRKVPKIKELTDFQENIARSCRVETLERLGGEGDGGYLVPIKGYPFDACFSPGVGGTIELEKDLISKGIRCYLSDGSVSGPGYLNSLLVFDRLFIRSFEDSTSTTMDKWIQLRESNSDKLLLQMDIEGSEYEALITISTENLLRFRVLIIEFHNLQLLLNEDTTGMVQGVFNRILEHFYVVHIHPNNNSKLIKIQDFEISTILEFTFLRKDLSQNAEMGLRIPHGLDRPNKANLPIKELAKQWFTIEKPSY